MIEPTFETICNDVHEGYANLDASLRILMSNESDHKEALDATSELLNLWSQKVLQVLAPLFSVCANSIPANWEVILGTRQERKIWEAIPQEQYAFSCDLMGVVSTFTDTVKNMKVGSTMLLTEKTLLQEIGIKTEQVNGFRRYSVSVLAADRILTDVVQIKTSKSRREALEKSVVHVYLFVLCLVADWLFVL